jgi:hypothetical protein
VEGVPDVNASFSARADVTADAAEDARALESSEATGDFLLHLDHADVLFGLVVGEGNPLIEEKGQHAKIKVLEAVQQVGGLALSAASLAPFAAGMETASP